MIRDRATELFPQRSKKRIQLCGGVVYSGHEMSGSRRTVDKAKASQVKNCFLKKSPIFVFYLDSMEGVEVGGGHVYFGDPQVYLVRDREKGSEHVELT